jgi:hypothetical protein
VGKRLEVTLFGTVCSVSVLHLSRDAVKAAVSTYGPAKWNSIVRDIALGASARRKMAEVSHTLGHPVKELYRALGFVMHDKQLGVEVFYGGEHVPIPAVAAENRTLQPKDLMKDCKLRDMLGVFWAMREGAMLFRWDDIEFQGVEELSLVFDGLAPLLGRTQSFDLILDVAWQGKRARRKDLGGGQGFSPLEHVFHIVG